MIQLYLPSNDDGTIPHHVKLVCTTGNISGSLECILAMVY